MKNQLCKELQTAGRERSSRKHPASAGYSEDRREAGPGNDYYSKSSHKSKKTINTFTFRELWRRQKETYEEEGMATQNTGRNEELQQAGFLKQHPRGTARVFIPYHMCRARLELPHVKASGHPLVEVLTLCSF